MWGSELSPSYETPSAAGLFYRIVVSRVVVSKRGKPEQTWASHHSCKMTSNHPYWDAHGSGRVTENHLNGEAHCSRKVTSNQPSPVVTMDNVEKEGSCVLPAHATLHYFVMSLLATLADAMKDVWSVAHLRVFSRVDDRVDALLNV